MDLKIKNIKIDKLFGKKQYSSELKTVNIIGGENGTGKSTILKCCYYLLKKGNLPDDTHLESLVGSVMIEFTNGWTLSWEKSALNPEIDIQSQNVSLYVKDTVVQKTLVKDENGQVVPVKDFLPKVKPYLAISFEQYISQAAQLFAIYAATDKSRDVTYIDTLIEEQLNIRNKKFAGTMERMLTLFSSVNNGENGQNLSDHDDIQQYLALYSVLKIFFKEYSISAGTELTFRKIEDIPFQRLSMGEKQLLYILLLAANTGNDSAILFLDEPDLGMHIWWKEQLVKAITTLAPNAQLIVTTHAPSLIKGWRECVQEMSHLTNEEK